MKPREVDDKCSIELSLAARLTDHLPAAVEAGQLQTQIAFVHYWTRTQSARKWIVVGGDDASEIDAVTRRFQKQFGRSRQRIDGSSTGDDES